jgi:hypothetical protein
VSRFTQKRKQVRASVQATADWLHNIRKQPTPIATTSSATVGVWMCPVCKHETGRANKPVHCPRCRADREFILQPVNYTSPKPAQLPGYAVQNFSIADRDSWK